jgi:hypothetical protein
VADELPEWMTYPEAGTGAGAIAAGTVQPKGPAWMQYPEVPPDQAAAPAPAETTKPAPEVLGTSEFGPIYADPAQNEANMAAQARFAADLPKGVVRGLRDIPDAGAQLLTRGIGAVAPEGSSFQKFMKDQIAHVEEINKRAEEEYQKGWLGGEASPGASTGRIIGNVAATAPIGYAMPGATAAGMLPRIASGAATGGVAGALQPVDTDQGDFWSQKAQQAGVGAGAGAAMAPVMGALSRVISPKTNPNVKTLMESGVTPTPGQILGGTANRLEEAGQSIPLVGDVIKAARGRAVEDVNRSAINQALAPIGEKLDEGTPLGREAIGEMKEKIGNAYNNLVPTLSVKADPQFAGNLTSLVRNAQYMHPDLADQFNKVLNDKVLFKFSPSGGMTGQSFKEVESEIGKLASDFTNSANAGERQLGGAYKQLQTEMRDLLVRSNPDKATQLSAINDAYAHSLRVEGAAARIGSDQGVFTPAQLLSSVRSLDPSLRKGAFARGDAKMQGFADAAKSVLGSKLPDSGTPFRSAVLAAGALGPLAAVNPMAAAGVAATGGAAALPYTKVGQRLAASLLASRGASAPGIASAVRSPALTPLAAALAVQGANQ